MPFSSLGYAQLRALIALGSSVEMDPAGWPASELRALAQTAIENGGTLTLRGVGGWKFADLQAVAFAGKSGVKFVE